jgi:hypothetical protein
MRDEKQQARTAQAIKTAFEYEVENALMLLDLARLQAVARKRRFDAAIAAGFSEYQALEVCVHE